MPVEDGVAWATPAQVAQLYRVRISTVLTWVRRGHTRRRTDGLVDVDRLDAYLAGRPQHGPGSGFHARARRPGAPSDMPSQPPES